MRRIILGLLILLLVGVYPALAVETVEPPITIDTFKSGDLIFDKSGDNWIYKKESGGVVGLEISGYYESIALLQKRVKVDLSKPLVVEYRLKFNFRESKSDATVNIFLNPLEDDAWWVDPIGVGHNGEIKGGILDFLHSFGPNRCWGGKVGVDNDVEGGALPCRSAEYPKNDEWITVKVIMTKEGFYVISKGDQGYYRQEWYSYDLSNVKYIAIGFGDQTKTRVECDYIKVYYTDESEIPKVKTVEPPIDIDEFKAEDLTFDKSGDNWVYRKGEGDIVGLEISGLRESVALLKKRIKVDLSNPIIVEYKIRFYFKDNERSHATVNVFLNPPENYGWWIDPIRDGENGYLNGGVLNFLHNFGPNKDWGGKVGVDNTIEGKGLPKRSAIYPKNGEWVTVKIKITKDGFHVISKGDQGYYREEYYRYDLSDIKYIAIGFGDQTKTRVECDYIKVYYETPKPKLTLTLNVPEKVYLNEKSTGTLKVKNVGNADANDVKVMIASPTLGIRVSKSYSLIPSKEARVITFEIKPKELGDFKVTATVKYKDSNGKEYTETTEELISVLPTPITTVTTITTTTTVATITTPPTTTTTITTITTVVKEKPIAKFVFYPSEPMAGDEITFDASPSYDIDGTIVKYEWKFSDGTTAEGKIVKHVFPSGTFTVTLTVIDNNGLKSTTTQQIYVKPSKQPRIIITYLGVNPEEVYQGDTVEVRADVVNVGQAEGTFKINLMVDGKITDFQEVFLKPNEHKTIIFKITADKLGTHFVQLGYKETVFPYEARFYVKSKPPTPTTTSKTPGFELYLVLIAIASALLFRKLK